MAMRTAITPRRVIETSLTIAEVVAGADGTDQTITVSGYGLTAEDFVIVRFTDLDADLTFCNEHISANNTLKIRFSNQSAGNITAGATTTKILVF
jgi:hypothetical protein